VKSKGKEPIEIKKEYGPAALLWVMVHSLNLIFKHNSIPLVVLKFSSLRKNCVNNLYLYFNIEKKSTDKEREDLNNYFQYSPKTSVIFLKVKNKK